MREVGEVGEVGQVSGRLGRLGRKERLYRFKREVGNCWKGSGRREILREVQPVSWILHLCLESRQRRGE